MQLSKHGIVQILDVILPLLRTLFLPLHLLVGRVIGGELVTAEWTRVRLNLGLKCQIPHQNVQVLFLPLPTSGRRTLCETCASRGAHCRYRLARTSSSRPGIQIRPLKYS